MVIVAAIVLTLGSLATAYIYNSITNSQVSQQTAIANQLNLATQRAILDGNTNAVLYGNDPVAAANYLVSLGYVQ